MELYACNFIVIKDEEVFTNRLFLGFSREAVRQEVEAAFAEFLEGSETAYSDQEIKDMLDEECAVVGPAVTICISWPEMGGV